MRSILTAVLLTLLVLLIFAPIGWLAYSYVAPEFHLPALTWWQFFCASVAARSLFGYSTK